jgi:hypothetical protein
VVVEGVFGVPRFAWGAKGHEAKNSKITSGVHHKGRAESAAVDGEGAQEVSSGSVRRSPEYNVQTYFKAK